MFRFLPKSWIIQREYVKLELLYVEQLRKRRDVLSADKSEDDDKDVDKDDATENNEVDDNVLNCSIVKLVIDNAVETINDPKFIVSLIATVRIFSFAEDIVQDMFKTLEEKYPDSPITWDTLAREELKHGVNQSTEKYIQSLEQLKSKELFQMAFSTLTECSTLYPKIMVRITKNILKLLKTGHENSLLGAEHYKFWIQILDDDVHSDEKSEIISSAVSQYPDNVDLRTEQLLFTQTRTVKMTRDRGHKTMMKCFTEAVEALQENQESSVKIWEVMLRSSSASPRFLLILIFLDWLM